MKKTVQIAPPLALNAGFFVEQEYQTYQEMSESSTENWEYHCTYELRPKALTGKHQILSLERMLISLGQRPGGMMHDVLSAEGSITLGVQTYVEDKSTFDKMKLQTNDIIIFDDTRAFNYMTNKKVELAVVTIKCEAFGPLLPRFVKACLHKLVDTDQRLGQLLNALWDSFTGKDPRTDYKNAEHEILTVLASLITEQEPQAPHLTRGEEIAYAIRKQVYEHMDGNLKISDLASKYQISEQGLQNSFKSLFGFTPKIFIRQLKLNLVRHDLSHNEDSELTVMRVAQKWGFLHMGRFSQYYSELFEENPSITLKRSFEYAKAFTGECVDRKEEIT